MRALRSSVVTGSKRWPADTTGAFEPVTCIGQFNPSSREYQQKILTSGSDTGGSVLFVAGITVGASGSDMVDLIV